MNFNDTNSLLENTISNKDHVSDVNYSLQYTRWFLRIIGVWPRVISKPTKIEIIASKIALLAFSMFMISVTGPIITFLVLRRGDRLGIITLLAPVTFQLATIAKHIVMMMRSKSIKLCMQHMETDWRRIENENDRYCMLRNVRVGNSLTIICAAFMYAGALLHHLMMPLFVGNTINEFNETIRPLAYPGAEIFIDVQADVVYELIFCSTCISALLGFTVSTSVFNLAAILVSHACGQIQIVISRLETLVDPTEEDDNNDVRNRIAFIIRNHVRLLKFISSIDISLREIYLLEVAPSTLIICFLEYYCIMMWSDSDRVGLLTYLTFLCSFSFNVFIYCQIGEVLNKQCEDVGRAAYRIEWYRLPTKSNLAVIMIITMGNYPRRLTAGGMMELSLSSFAAIMKTSFAYLNLMRTVA